jgi:hypothetical protein
VHEQDDAQGMLLIAKSADGADVTLTVRAFLAQTLQQRVGGCGTGLNDFAKMITHIID